MIQMHDTLSYRINVGHMYILNDFSITVLYCIDVSSCVTGRWIHSVVSTQSEYIAEWLKSKSNCTIV